MKPFVWSPVSLLVTLLATVRVPRFRAVLVRLCLPVPVLRSLRSGIPLAADRRLACGLGSAGRLTADGWLTANGWRSEILLT